VKNVAIIVVGCLLVISSGCSKKRDAVQEGTGKLEGNSFLAIPADDKDVSPEERERRWQLGMAELRKVMNEYEAKEQRTEKDERILQALRDRLKEEEARPSWRHPEDTIVN